MALQGENTVVDLIQPENGEQRNDDYDVNGNFVSNIPIQRHRRTRISACSETLGITIAIWLICLELFWMVLLLWLYLSGTKQESSVHRSFGWKQINEFFFMSIKNSSKRCQTFREAIQVDTSLRIRPLLHSNDICVTDEVFTTCHYDVSRIWNWSSSVPILTFLSPAVIIITSSVFLLTRSHLQRDILAKMTFAVYIICAINMIVFVFGWVSQFIHLEIDTNSLKDYMIAGMNVMSSPDLISDVWKVTQESSKCCGLMSYHDWHVSRNGSYPSSCCNTELHECKTYPSKDQVWKTGCYEIESRKFRYYSGLTLFIWFFKMCNEIMLSCALCDGHSASELMENSVVRMNGFSIRAGGRLDIAEVTGHHRIMIIVTKFQPGMYELVTLRSESSVRLSLRRGQHCMGYATIIPQDDRVVEEIFIDEERGQQGIYEVFTHDDNNDTRIQH